MFENAVSNMKNTFWDTMIEFDNEYDIYRKKIMERHHLSAVEVDVMLFLANNSQYDTAAEVSRIKKIPKSHVSLAVSGLYEKGYLVKYTGEENRKKVHLKVTDKSNSMIAYGRAMQSDFLNTLFLDFSEDEKIQFFEFSERMVENIHKNKNHTEDR